MTTSTPFMPVFGERTAPTFNGTHPNHLPRFFAQLEALFDRCNVSSELKKKSYMTSYAAFEIAELWEALPEYRDASKTYIDFRACLLGFYRQDSLKYTASDLDRVIQECQQIGFHSLHDLSAFHLRFNAISSCLVSVDLLSPREQSQAYLQAFNTALSHRISIRLQVAHRTHLSSRPYTIDQIFDAAEWVLLDILTQTSSSSSMNTSRPASTLIEPLEVSKISKTSNFAYRIAQSDKSSCFSTQIDVDVEELSQEALDNRIASLEAELAALRAEMALENKEEAQAGDFEIFGNNSLQNPVISQQGSIDQTQTHISSLNQPNRPIFQRTPSQVDTSTVCSVYTTPQAATRMSHCKNTSIDQYIESTALHHRSGSRIASIDRSLEHTSQKSCIPPSEPSTAFASVNISQFIDSSHKDIAGPHRSLSTFNSDRSTHRITSTFDSVGFNLTFITPDNKFSSDIVSSVSDTVPDSPIASISTSVMSTSISSSIELPETQSSSQVVPNSSYRIPSSQSNLSHHRTASIELFIRSTSKSNRQDAPVPSIDPPLQPTSQITDVSHFATSATCSALTQVIDDPLLSYSDLDHATFDLDLPTRFPAAASVPIDSHHTLNNSDTVSHSYSTEIIPAVLTSTFDPVRPIASPYIPFISSITPVNSVSPSIAFVSSSISHKIPSNSSVSLVFFVLFVLTLLMLRSMPSRGYKFYLWPNKRYRQHLAES